MKSFREMFENKEVITEKTNKGSISGTEITWKTKDGKMVSGPAGKEQSYVTIFSHEGEDAVEVVGADQGILSVKVIDEESLGYLLNDLFII